MLASAESVEVVADAIRNFDVPASVIDPVRPHFSRETLW